MTHLFFYGTLQHIPLLEIVLGRNAHEIDFAPATLPGHRVYAVHEGPFPTILIKNGASAKGLLVRGLTAEDIGRLNFYEGSFDYDLTPVTLTDGQSAHVYLSAPDRWTATDPWSLAGWIDAHGAMTLHAAREVMGYYGVKTQAEVAPLFPRIRARAAAKVRAAQTRHGARTLQGKVEIDTLTRAYAGFFALDEMTLRHAQFDGTMSRGQDRAVFVVSDAAILLPYDPDRDRVLLVEQIRMGPVLRGDRRCWQLEAIAGMVDAGEEPADTARREAQEEAGLTLKSLEPVAEVYASPGNSTEFYYIYVGLADLPDGTEGTGGLDSEGEDIRSHLMSFDDLMDYVDNFHAANTPLVLSAYWLARHRERLRSG
ncbi:NUDIX domain-containing protein [Sulfitobacter aestuariivivens]|uniref:ADP-ribose pyrophosphatase n=1 Tax=Sulfitobacter aestuariivivens TaxID=2766981 RepID=A0A927HEB4_9RHOB|nr:NUDIX domain-containing protein [Sulfitobacter aestuariivivens]MBD3663203.1 NUDIX domain-containing protein [Sulfitobacter aestuariivivens]